MTDKRYVFEDDVLLDILTAKDYYEVEEVVDLLNEQHEQIHFLNMKYAERTSIIGEQSLKIENLEKENEQLKKQMQRLYNYFVDWHGDIMGANQFSEMWDDVKEDEDWED